jgi:uncharacterized repeat protein (TIGR03803 family)
MLAAATDDPTDGYRQNGGTVAPATTILQNAVNVGLSYQPVFLEYWCNDATNPALDSTMQSATVSMEGNHSNAAASGPATLASFTAAAGLYPEGGLIRDGSGNLYGVTSTGGASNDGTVFEVAAGSGAITTLASFAGADGISPVGTLVMDGSGNLYGTAYAGGASNDGTVFELARGSGHITVLASFNGTNGANPAAGLVLDASGNLYGTASQDGASGCGTVFEVARGSGTVRTLVSFTGANGAAPDAALVIDAAGNLYGTASQGGAAHGGTVFEVAAGSGTLTTLAAFRGANGAAPAGPLVLDAAGNLYGTTTQGGAYVAGTVFEVAAGSGTLTTLASFTGANGAAPYAGLVLDAAGNLYGTTTQGGASGYGVVFELARGSGAITPLASFTGANGIDPYSGVVLDGGGNLYGTTYTGGVAGYGTVFEVAAGSGTVTTLASFTATAGNVPQAGLTADAGGNLYGTTSCGGAFNDGTVFEVAAGSGTITTLASFNGTNGADPYAGLVLDAAGNLYGTTAFGGACGCGTVFEVAAGSGTVTALASLNAAKGEYPEGGLVMDAAGNLYGTTFAGGASNLGTVFELPTGATKVTTLASFDGAHGQFPQGGLVIDATGNLYGTTSQGGASGYGTVFEVAAGSGTVSTLASFNGTNGSGPQGNLAADAAGNLYGSTTGGGASGQGTVFEVTRGNGTVTTLAAFNGTHGADPQGGLVMDSGGSVYGTTVQGGATGYGTAFKLAPGSGTITTLASFSGMSGGSPYASLAIDSAGNLYGAVPGGAAAGQGAVFELPGAAAAFIDQWTGADSAVDTNWSDGANWSTGSAPTAGQTALFTRNATVQSFTATMDVGFTHAITGLVIDGTWGGTITVNGPLSVTGNLSLAGGSLGGSGAVKVAGSASRWTGGQLLVGAGGFTNTGTLTADTTGGNLILTGAGTFKNGGTMNEAGTNRLLLENGAKLSIAAGAIFNLTGDGGVGQVRGGTLANAGTLEKTGGTGTSVISSAIANSAAITVQTGTLALASSGGTSTGGTFSVCLGATLDLTGGSTTAYAGTYTGSGAGTVVLGSGTLKAGTGGATFNMTGNSFQWTGGAIDVSNGGFTNAGTIQDPGTGNVVVTGAGTFTNGGTMNEAGTNCLLLENGATLSNAAGAIFNLTGDGGVGQVGGGTLANAGTLEKTGGTGTSVISSAIANSAAITVKAGTLALASAGGTSTGGTFTVAGGATLDLTGGSTTAYAGTYTGSGLGTILLGGGTLKAGPGGATFNMAGNFFQWTGGTIDVSNGNFVNTGTVNYSGGAVTGTGSLVNAQTMIQTGTANLLLNNGATLSNAATGTYQLKGSGGVAGSGGGALANAGLFLKLTDAGTATIATSTLSNTGTVEVDSGTLNVAAAVTQLSGNVLTAGTWTVRGSATVPSQINFTAAGPVGVIGAAANVTLAGANASFSNLSGLQTIAQGGSLALQQGQSLTVSGALTNSGNLTLGAGCRLTLGGGFTQLSTGTFNMQLGGTAAAPTFGRLVSSTGAVALGGTLNVTSAVVPAVGSSFKVVDNGGGAAVGGSFAGLPEGATFTVTTGTTVMTFQITYAGAGGNGGRNVLITRIA